MRKIDLDHLRASVEEAWRTMPSGDDTDNYIGQVNRRASKLQAEAAVYLTSEMARADADVDKLIQAYAGMVANNLYGVLNDITATNPSEEADRAVRHRMMHDFMGALEAFLHDMLGVTNGGNVVNTKKIAIVHKEVGDA